MSFAASNVHFTLAASAPVITIQWDRELDAHRKAGLYRVFAEALEAVEGVEGVYMGRYSAEIEVATHVKTTDEVMIALFDEVFAHDGAFVSYLEQRFGKDWSTEITQFAEVPRA